MAAPPYRVWLAPRYVAVAPWAVLSSSAAKR